MNIISFDTETRGLDWFDPDHRAFLATWADAEGQYQADLAKPRETNRFVKALKTADLLIAHNFSFDCHHVREATGFDILTNPKYLRDEQELHDTDLMSRVMFPEGQRKGERGGHGLKNLAKVYLRADADGPEEHIKQMGKAIGLRTLKQTGAYYEVWRAYPQVMEEYARMDARYTYDIFMKFADRLRGSALEPVYDLEMRVMPILIRAEQRGVAIDQKVVRRLMTAAKKRQREALAYLKTELGEDALGGPGSEAGLIEALLKIGVPLHRKTKGGDQLSTDKYALQEFEDDFPQIAALQELRQSEKFMSTYLAPMVDRPVVHPSFYQCNAWTGRMSCSRPNMQNLPKRAGKEMREMFIPRPDHSFVAADYESIEARLLAYYLGDKGYCDLMERGLDPHAWMASNIHGGDMAQYEKGTEGEAQRNIAKNTLFAIVYGAGAPRVGDMNKITRDEAKQLIGTIKNSLPGFYRLNNRIREKIGRVGHVNTVVGRKQVVSPDKSYVGLNALIQGSAADIFKQGIVNVNEVLQGFDAHILLFIHDEVVIECPTPVAERCRQAVVQAMADAYRMSPSLTVEGVVAHNNFAEAA